MSDKYLVGYIQNGPDSEGYDPSIDYTLKLIFDTSDEATNWVRSFVDPNLSKLQLDTSIVSDNGIRKEAHIIRCIYGSSNHPYELHRLVEVHHE